MHHPELRPAIYAAFSSLALTLAGISPSAAASPITSRTSCGVARWASDNNDESMHHQISLYLATVFNKLDQSHTVQGEPGIIPKLGQSGVDNLTQETIEYCIVHPTDPIDTAAASAYNDIRILEMELAQPTGTPANANLEHER
jgi:hypothetical protein